MGARYRGRTTVYLGSYASRFTPQTNMGASEDGAEMMTFFAPPFRWAPAFSAVVNTPCDREVSL
jgi:hypothetical protein